MDVPLLGEQVALDNVIVNKTHLRINHVESLHTVEDKTVFVQNDRYFTGHAHFWNAYYGLSGAEEDVGFEELANSERNTLVSKEVDCTNLQKYMLTMGPKYMNIMFDIQSFKLSEDVATLINVAWIRLFHNMAFLKIMLSCVLLGGLYIPTLARPFVAQCCAPLHLFFMLASANMFRKNTKHIWLFTIDIITAVPLTLTVLESRPGWIPMPELSTYAYTVLYLVSIQQLLQMTQVPVIGYIDNVFINSLKLVMPVIFSVLFGMVVIDMLNIQQTEADNIVDKFLLMYDSLSRISFEFRRKDMQAPYNEYFIVVLIVLIIIVKAMCVSVFFMVRDTVSDMQKSMERRQHDEIMIYRLQFITSIWTTYRWFLCRAFLGKRAIVLSKA